MSLTARRLSLGLVVLALAGCGGSNKSSTSSTSSAASTTPGADSKIAALVPA